MYNGSFVYKNLMMSQNKNTPIFLNKLLAEKKPTRVLEIGTFHGALTLLLRDLLDINNLEDSVVRTYDTAIQKYLIPKVTDEIKIEIFNKNIFNYNYNDFKDEESKEEIASFISSGSPTLVLCDGGCKRCEFNTISPLLKKGDIIMAHDYAPNKQYFDDHIHKKIWGWMEIQDRDVKDISERLNLQPYKQEEAQKAAWLCKIRC